MITTLIIICYICLGLHSAWFFKHRYTQYFDLTTNEIPNLIVSFLVPIVAHLATHITFPNIKKRNYII